ncbi:metal-dependent hydrolase [Gemmatimonas sp.]|uniref:metal-dependent hydrolase n=1 Tax=Gemmatimonas sp. TaxID=1962908 RepID=UPI0035658261
MDNVTHALAGLLMADATVSYVQRRIGLAPPGGVEAPSLARFRRAAVVLGIAAAEFPDVDLVYSGPMVAMGKLGYLLHHRGHTHTVVWALVGAVLLWAATRWWWQRGLEGHERLDPSSAIVSRVGARALLVLAIVGTLSHLLLDFTNSYGVHPFWPFDNRWYYGDAIFIVEPWLMVTAIPPLVWGPRRLFGRVLLLVALAAVLALCWFAGEVSSPVALAVTVMTLIGLLLQRAVAPAARPFTGIAAWVVVTNMFFLSSAQSRAVVRELVSDGSLRDVVLTPSAADPRCFSAIVVTATATEYRVTTAAVAPWSSALNAAGCVAARSGRARNTLGSLAGASRSVPFSASPVVAWGETWAVPRADFVALAATRCEFAAAMRFYRSPVWSLSGGGVAVVDDARFGADGGGFAGLSVGPGVSCSLDGKWIPPWVPPRADVLSPGK